MIFTWDANHKRSLKRWSDRWGTPDLPGLLVVEYSTRMSRNLGRCYPAQYLIRLNPVLSQIKNASLLRETICHEAAHVAVYCLHGTAVQPHGQEWQELMRRSGYEPRVTIPANEVHALPEKVSRPRYRYTHRCTDCNTLFVAARTDRRWRCSSCRDKGKSGDLVVSRRLIA